MNFFFFFGGGGGGGWGLFNYRRIIVINPVHQNVSGLVDMTYRLVYVSCGLPKWQAVKLTFFAPCLNIHTNLSRWFTSTCDYQNLQTVEPLSLACFVNSFTPKSGQLRLGKVSEN